METNVRKKKQQRKEMKQKQNLIQHGFLLLTKLHTIVIHTKLYE